MPLYMHTSANASAMTSLPCKIFDCPANRDDSYFGVPHAPHTHSLHVSPLQLYVKEGSELKKTTHTA